MISLNISGILIFFVLAVFSLFQLFIVFCSSKYKIWKLKYKYGDARYNQNLNVVVYSHNNAEAVVELLENLKKQEYPLDKVKINIILDNCTDNSSNLLEILGGAKIWRISTGQNHIGRDAAFEWFLDRTLATENTNAFVFLDCKNRINPMLLMGINNAIGEFPAVVGKVSRSSGNKFLTSIMNIYDLLNFNVTLKGRSMAGLSNIADTEILAIRQEVLEKVRFINVKNQNTGMLYSLLLSKAKIPVVYSDEVTVFRREISTVKSFIQEKRNEFNDKIKTFFYSLHLLSEPVNIKTKELILSLIYPNDFVVATLFLALAVITVFSESFILGSAIPRYLLSFCVITTIYTIILSKMSFVDILIWIAKIITAPLMFSGNLVGGINLKLPQIKIKKPSFNFNLPAMKFTLPSFSKRSPKNVTQVFVTNGTKDIPCGLEIKNSGGFYSAILWFNNKKISSSQFLNAPEALADLSEKLFDKNFALKVCQNCGYFESAKDDKYGYMNGSCLLGIAKHGRKEPYSTQISYCCKFIIPAHAKDYVRKQIENLDGSREN